MKDKYFDHAMLDIETLGDESNSVIVSIGVVEFNMNTGETGRKFYRKIDIQSCLDLGLKVVGKTLYWWFNQNQEAIKELTKSPSHIADVLLCLNEWFLDCHKDIQLWGNGSRFDIGILEDAYKAANILIPWNFRKERDVRTLVAFNENIKETTPFKGVYHNPIDDCLHQIKYCTEIAKTLNLKL